MRCAVKNCNNDNASKACAKSFFAFPTNAAKRKEWTQFCFRNESFNVKTSVICMDHFNAEDFANNLQYEMGFTKRRLLKKGVVPSIKKTAVAREELHEECIRRIEKRYNKKIVERLLKECETASVADSAKIPQTSSEESKKDFEVAKKSEMERLKQELELLRKENRRLKNTQRKQAAQLKLRKIQKRSEKKSFHKKLLFGV